MIRCTEIFRKAGSLAPFLLFLAGCCGEASLPKTDSVEVGFAIGSGVSRVAMEEDALSVKWTEGDKAALWAKSQYGYVLSATEFSQVARGGQVAYFTATLPSPMQEGTYRYKASYPLPSSSLGSYITFPLPSEQGGEGNEMILLSDEERAPALRPLSQSPESGPLTLSLKPKMHLLRFFMEEDAAAVLNGGKISQIVAEFPHSVAGGTVNFDISEDDFLPSHSGGTRTLTLNLERSLGPSAGSRDYRYGVIFPQHREPFESGDSLRLRLYSEDNVFEVRSLPLEGRTFEGGHATAVRLIPTKKNERGTLTFRFGCLFGEGVTSITLTAPSGCFWDNGSNVRVLTPTNVPGGENITLDFGDISAFRSLDRKQISVKYDLPHAYADRTLTMPDLSSAHDAVIDISLSYLLWEDFSRVPTFSSNDEYSAGLNSGDKPAYTFLTGWSGGRIGGSAGLCVRLAARRETSANYPARLDCAPLSATLKAGAKIQVEFDYGAAQQYTSIMGVSLGQTVYLGYTTNPTATYHSGSSTGSLEEIIHISSSENSGTYDNLPHHFSGTMSFSSEQTCVRLAFRTDVDHQAGMNNNTNWFYIDNIKVTLIND